MTSKEYTRKQRLDDECTHREYFAQFATAATKNIVMQRIGIKAILTSNDDSLNDIGLDTWDCLPDFPRSTFDHMKQLGDSMSMAGKVCIYKEAAKQIKEEHTKV